MVLDVLLGILGASMLVVVWRVFVGPTNADRVVAVDLGFALFVAAAALLAVRMAAPYVLIIVLAATLVGFLATVAIAHVLEQRSP